MKKKLFKISLAVMCVFSVLAVVGNQVQTSTTTEIKSDEPVPGEVRDGGPGSGFVLFSVSAN